MRRKWAYILAITLLLTLVSAETASAKKSRSKRVSSRGQIKRDKGRAKPGHRLSRREKSARGKYATRGRRGRREGRSRRSTGTKSAPQAAVASGVSRPIPGINAERTTEIQNALIKAGYLNGPASGQYDDATVDAMKQFQANNGLSQTGLPSASLLKKLGVPKRSNDGYAVPVRTVSENNKKRPGGEPKP
ncbi:MAG: peptidoglycan-binding domain-containing protein [Blastocatellia bacterium]